MVLIIGDHTRLAEDDETMGEVRLDTLIVWNQYLSEDSDTRYPNSR